MTDRNRLLMLSSIAVMGILLIPAFSARATVSTARPDSDLILFNRDTSPAGSDPRQNAYTLNLQTGKQTRITSRRTLAQAWSHDGTRILAEEPDNYAGGSLVVFDADGKNRHPLTDVRQMLIRDAGWSADDKRIIFRGSVLKEPRYWAIFDIPAEGGEMRLLTPPIYESDGYGLAISPDGSQIFFTRIGMLFSVPANGGEVTEIRMPLRLGDRLTFSPDGTQIAAGASGPDNASGIYLFTPDGQNIRLLVPSTKDMIPYSPEWSPDGSELLFVAQPGQNTPHTLLNIVDTATGIVRTYRAGEGVLKSLTAFGNVAWSADGTQIVFSSGEKEYYAPHLYLVDREFTRIRQLTRGSGINSVVGWRPAAQ